MKTTLGARLAPAALGFALALCAFEARARAAEGDGLYGRFDGDLTLHVGAGVALSKDGPLLAARLEALYLSTAGIYVHYADALGRDDALTARSIAAGFSIQPLFLGRFGSDLEHGPARLDLFLDSFALQLGALWYQPKGASFVRDPGLEFAAALGFPLLADATGPFIDVRAALRWRAVDLGPYPQEASGIFDRGALLSIGLSWHHVITAHIVDAGDRLSR